MAKIPRVFQRIFGTGAPGSGEGAIGEFGSFAAGNPVVSTDLSVIQSLGAWVNGWLSAVIGNNGPCLEDMNAFCYVITTQMAYNFQAGIAEWDTGTSYYIGSLVNVGGLVYVSLTDGNTGNAVTDATKWSLKGGAIKAVTVDYPATALDDFIKADATGGSLTVTLPAAASSKGLKFSISRINSGSNTVTVAGNGSETIDGANTFALNNQYDNVGVICNGASWNVVGSFVVPNASVTRPKLSAVGQQVSSGSGTFQTSSATFVDVTNLAVTVTTTGRPVLLRVESDANVSEETYLQQSAPNKHGYIRFTRAGASIANARFGDQETPPSSFSFLDTPAAGTYIYKVQLRDADATGAARLYNSALVAYEL